mmetsp:Transcript_23781/g.39872  ORF Transcript_23781/g.39872 Transcript_23781/m.39872 type:complete len:137 (+) Transcript_23781:373-783(+)|eukprot:CAMPEP_0198200114 /NCGR_PEP_ID=MMETSP1445-20131203/3178_1 /TAXON_ID=36898 /ORGANISM="Pyramimonas sp., Strain CCMP2087" /LENGTH=136 /DNA_ID=CAMNT_0043870073 /DNA_START=342 /DNA_END=752 /DNA_ORIENTATION=+
MKRFFKRNWSGRTSKEHVRNECGIDVERKTTECTPASTQQRLHDTTQRVESLRTEVRTVREDLVATLDALQGKEDDSEKLFQIVQMLEKDLHTSSSRRTFAEDVTRSKEQEVLALQAQLNSVRKELEHQDMLLSEQ